MRSIKKCKLQKSIFFTFLKKSIFSIFLFRRYATPKIPTQMGFGLGHITATMYAPNPQTRNSQPLSFAPVEMTKSEIGVKNDSFLPIFELLYFNNAERSEAPTYGVGRTTPRHYTYQTTKAQRPRSSNRCLEM